MLVIPRTNAIASRMLDLPDPLRPVIALKDGSQSVIVVRTGYDLNPKDNLSSFLILLERNKTVLTLENEFFNPHGGGG